MQRVFSLTLLSLSLLPTLMGAVNLHTCTKCHGKNFEKSAMGLSQIVKDLSQEDLTKALEGYKNETHGGTMQIVMSNQISKFTEEEIEEIVKDIRDGNITDIVEEAPKDERKDIEVNLSSCLSCHGMSFEKPALGVSRILAELSKEDIKAALQGYKDGTYGGNRDALMVNQVINFSDEEIEAIAEQIFDGYHYE